MRKYFFKDGDPMKGTLVIITGRIKISASHKNGVKNIGYLNAEDVTGHLPFSRGSFASLDAQVVEHAQVMTFPIEKMKELTSDHFELTQANDKEYTIGIICVNA